MATPIELHNYIAGRWVEGDGEQFLDTNPARSDDVVATGNFATRRQLDDAVGAAREAFDCWSRTPAHERAGVLQRAATILDARAGDWGYELAREEGKTLPEGVAEVRRAAGIFRFFAAEADRPIGELFASPRPGETIQLVHRPVGPVAAITPFNFPIAIPAWKIAPALIYGNVVVWKPASAVPLLAVRLVQALEEAGLPSGVLSLVISPGPQAAQLVEHPGIDAVTFTGSTAVGRSLIAACGRLARPIQTEMGGKNAAAVLSDADLDLAVREVAAGAFRSAGQKCTATSRVIVAESVADEFLKGLLERLNALRVGDPLEDHTDMGPVISNAAREEIYAALERSRSNPAATVLAGGERYDDQLRRTGAFVAPTVFELTDEDPLWREEVFGPVLAVRRARDDTAVLDLVNDSDYGLSAAVFTESLGSVADAVARLDVGVLHINSETAGAEPHVPFGGAKQSGFGPKEQGRAAREFFTRTTTVYLCPASAP